MNGENLHQSLVSKERLLDFALRANSGSGPLSNKKFPARIWQRLDNFFGCRLIPEMLHILYIFEGSLCINTSKRFFE